MKSISLILCTYNRCRSLAQALESVAASIMPNSVEWDVLVADNNSKDQTKEVVEDFGRRYPGRFQYMFVSQQGKSHALNAAIRAARGDVLAFTDDDVTVEPSWLENLTAPFEDSKWSGTAGQIRLGGHFSPPSWLPISGAFNLGGSIVQFDEGKEQAELKRAPFGANMAFRKSMFTKYGDFRTDLGRKGKSLIGNEDTELGERLLAAGEHLCYVPTAIVNHPVLPERLTKRYFRAYWFSYGRSVARQAGTRLPLWKIPWHYLRQFKRKLHWMHVVDRHWVKNPHGRFFCETLICQMAGEMLETYQKSKGHKARENDSSNKAVAIPE
jgi:glycosyltransferase involved in cell wall biosynthesis